MIEISGKHFRNVAQLDMSTSVSLYSINTAVMCVCIQYSVCVCVCVSLNSCPPVVVITGGNSHPLSPGLFLHCSKTNGEQEVPSTEENNTQHVCWCVWAHVVTNSCPFHLYVCECPRVCAHMCFLCV